MKRLRLLVAAPLVLFVASSTRAAITFDQIDTFQTSSLAGWGGGAFPTRVADGGPDGLGDGFLRIGHGTGGVHVGTRNRAQWGGDYITAGVEAIEMDMKNISILETNGSTNLAVRIMLFGPGGTWAYTNLTLVVPHWRHYVFYLDEANFTYVPGGEEPPGTGIFADTLADVDTLLIRHDRPTPTAPADPHPPHLRGYMGIDNIHAFVPEPASVLTLLVAAPWLLRRR